MNANEPTKPLTPTMLANQLFDAALIQYRSDPREAARQVIVFLTEALVHTILATGGDEAARKAMLQSIGESIVAVDPTPAAG